MSVHSIADPPAPDDPNTTIEQEYDIGWADVGPPLALPGQPGDGWQPSGDPHTREIRWSKYADGVVTQSFLESDPAWKQYIHPRTGRHWWYMSDDDWCYVDSGLPF